MTTKFKIQQGLRVNSVDVIDSTGNFIGGNVRNITFTTPATHATLTLGNNTTLNFPNSLQFPSTTGSNGYILKTNGAGVLSWSAMPAPTMPPATISTLGAVIIGAGLEITNSGVLSTSVASFGNIDGGGPTSIYGGMPVVDGGGI